MSGTGPLLGLRSATRTHIFPIKLAFTVALTAFVCIAFFGAPSLVHWDGSGPPSRVFRPGLGSGYFGPPPHPDLDYGPGSELSTLPEELQPDATQASGPGLGAGPTPAYVNREVLTLEDIRLLVGTTEGLFARDWDLSLGWNNMRYIIEGALLQAKLLRRTLILPSFVYARGCQYDVQICSDYAPVVNRGDAVDSDEWRDLPAEEQMAWVIPIEVMLNITHLRETHPVITISDYLLLHNQSSSVEASKGYWERDIYHTGANVFTGQKPSLFVIENSWYDPKGIVRVDRLTEDMRLRMDDAGRAVNGTIDESLRKHLPDDKHVLEWRKIEEALGSTDPEELERALIDGGWEVLYTYDSVAGLDYNKAVVAPIKQAAPRSSIRAFDKFRSQTADVVLLAGGVHYGRKPGFMLFTTREAQDAFSSLVLYDLQRIGPVLELAHRVADRMYEITEDRQWMAAHVRRGDFVRYHWAMEESPQEHIARVKRHLGDGRELLASLNTSEAAQTYDIPGLYRIPRDRQVDRLPPVAEDWFFVATDERDPHVLDLFHQQGAVFMDDLLSIADRRAFGEVSDIAWTLMIADIRGIIEQVVLSRADYFYGHAMSSVPGGVVNLRAARGADSRTSYID